MTCLLTKFVPRLHVDSIYDIDLLALQQAGKKGIITDLDNTLVGAAEPDATPKVASWLEQAKQLGFKVVVVSNNNAKRVERFAAPLKLPFIHRAQKPKRSSFKKALHMMKLEAQQAIVIGDQMLTDVFGGNRMGLYTILVRAISLEHEGFFTRINRRVEKMMLERMKRKGIELQKGDRHDR